MAHSADHIPLPKMLPIRLVERVGLREESAPFPQVHGCIEIGRCLRGNGLYLVGDRCLHLSADEVVVIGCGVPHLAQELNPRPSRWRWIQFDAPRLLGQLGPCGLRLAALPLTGAAFPIRFTAVMHPGVIAAEEALAAALSSARMNQDEVRSLIMLLLARLETACPQQECRALDPTLLDRIRPAIEHIHQAFASNVQVEDLAARCATSPSNLWRWFTRAVGCSPQQYLQGVRIRHGAAMLLDGECSVEAVSRAVGYGAVSSFNRHFRTLLGRSPDAWRRG